MDANNEKLTKQKLEELLAEAAEAHHEYEKELGRAHQNWPGWYANYIIKKLEGKDE